VPLILADGIPLPFRAELGPLWSAATVQVPLSKFMASPLFTIQRALANGTARALALRRALFLLRKELRFGSGSPLVKRPDFGSAPGHVVRAVFRRMERTPDCAATGMPGAKAPQAEAKTPGSLSAGAGLVLPGAITVDELLSAAASGGGAGEDAEGQDVRGIDDRAALEADGDTHEPVDEGAEDELN